MQEIVFSINSIVGKSLISLASAIILIFTKTHKHKTMTKETCTCETKTTKSPQDYINKSGAMILPDINVKPARTRADAAEVGEVVGGEVAGGSAPIAAVIPACPSA